MAIGTGDRYRVQKPLAEGGEARVFLAHDEKLQRTVVIKVLRDGLSGESADGREALARFERECRILATSTHPALLPVLDWGRLESGAPFYVMPHIEGARSLAAAIADRRSGAGGPPSRRFTLRIVEELGHAIDFLHARGIVHRDINPSNVLLHEDDRPFLIDLGLAGQRGSKLTESGALMGTMAYLSPEQATGLDVGPPSDLYQLGLLAYELITGSRAVQEIDDYLRALGLGRRPFPAPSARAVGIGPELDAVIAKATALEAARRYPSGSALASALTAVPEKAWPGDETAASRAEIGPGHRLDARSGAARATETRILAPIRTAREAPTWSSKVTRSIVSTIVACAVTSVVFLAVSRLSSDRHGGPDAPSIDRTSDGRLSGQGQIRSALPKAGSLSIPRHRGLAIRVPAPVPPGTKFQLSDERGQVVANGTLTADGDADFEELPPDVTLRFTAIDVGGLALVEPLEVRTPSIIPLRGFACLPADTGVFISFGLPAPSPIKVEILSGGARTPVVREQLQVEDVLFGRYFAGLRPGTEYVLRVLFPSGWGGLGSYRFRTRPPGHLAMVEMLAKAVVRDQSYRDLATDYYALNPDPRGADLFVDLIRKTSGRELLSLAKVGRLGSSLRHRRLTDALVPLLEIDRDPGVRAAILRAMVAVRHPKCAEALERLLSGRTDDSLAVACAEALAVGGGTAACDRIGQLLTRHSDCTVIGVSMLRASPDRARARFESWLFPVAEGEPLQARACLRALIESGTEEDVRILARLLGSGGHEWAVAGAAHALGQIGTPVARRVLLAAFLKNPRQPDLTWSVARLGIQEAAPLLVQTLARSTAASERRHAAGALGLLGTHEGSELLERALADASIDVAAMAAWALGRRRESRSAGPLLTFAVSERDLSGTGAWALARLGVVDAGPALTGLLDRLASSVDSVTRSRLMMVVRALGDLRTTVALPDLRRLVADARQPAVVRDVARSAVSDISATAANAPVDSGRRRDTVLDVLPSAVFERAPIRLLAGDSVDLTCQGWLGLATSENLARADAPASFGPGSPSSGLLVLVGDDVKRVGRLPVRVLAVRETDLVLSLYDSPFRPLRARPSEQILGMVRVVISR